MLERQTASQQDEEEIIPIIANKRPSFWTRKIDFRSYVPISNLLAVLYDGIEDILNFKNPEIINGSHKIEIAVQAISCAIPLLALLFFIRDKNNQTFFYKAFGDFFDLEDNNKIKRILAEQNFEENTTNNNIRDLYFFSKKGLRNDKADFHQHIAFFILRSIAQMLFLASDITNLEKVEKAGMGIGLSIDLMLYVFIFLMEVLISKLSNCCSNKYSSGPSLA